MTENRKIASLTPLGCFMTMSVPATIQTSETDCGLFYDNECTRYNPNLRNGLGGIEQFHSHGDGYSGCEPLGSRYLGHGVVLAPYSVHPNSDPHDELAGIVTLHLSPQNAWLGSLFSLCMKSSGLEGLGFNEEAANLIQNISDLEGTSTELLSVTMKNEGGFDLRKGPRTNFHPEDITHWDVGPFQINIGWIMKMVDAKEISDRGLIKQNMFGYTFYNTDGKTPTTTFDGVPLENGRMAARHLNSHGGSDENKAVRYAPDYAKSGRRRDFRKYASRFRTFYKCYHP
jgi:hypothetical protein